MEMGCGTEARESDRIDADVKVAGFKHGPCASCRFCVRDKCVWEGKDACCRLG